MNGKIYFNHDHNPLALQNYRQRSTYEESCTKAPMHSP